jgi:hypothetical protein
LLLWSLNASGIIAEMQGHKVFVVACDAANAFSTLWRHGVSWVLWTIWRMLHLIEIGLNAFVMINGHKVQLPPCERGANQGAH